jgi:hypothetical protein
MPNWKIWKKDLPREPQSALPGRTATAGEPIIPEAALRSGAPPAPDRIATLKRRRAGILFDVEQSELANQAENPWRERIALLQQTIADIRLERERLEALPRIERPVPPNQLVTVGRVVWQDPASVEFSIADEAFRYESEIDWAERGTYVTRNELERRAGDPARFAPERWPEDERLAFIQALNDALFIFATELRTRAENGTTLPAEVSLADLISPCPICGDWRLWGGFCPACIERDRKRRALEAEIAGRLQEISAEEEQRAKIAERLPVALRRLADVETELRSLGVTD